jgi:hypothetical protein
MNKLSLLGIAVALAAFVNSGAAAQANPVPFVLQRLIPGAAVPGGAGFTLTVNGAGFVSGAVVNWNGSPRSTTFVTGTMVQAQIPASDIAAAGTALVTIGNPTPGGGTSNVALFSITKPITSVSFARQTRSQNSPTYSLALGDLNRDNKLDAIFALNYGLGALDFASYVNQAGSLKLRQTIIPNLIQGGQIAVGDLNRDGILDLVAANLKGLAIFPGKGDGTFTKGSKTTAGPDPYSLAVADFNHDGNLDVAVADVAMSEIFVLLGNGDGTLQAGVTYPTGSSPLSLIVNDFNRDGFLDLAVANTDPRDNSISVLLGNGDGTFQTQQKYPIPPNAYSVASIDLNSDGFPDLVAVGKQNSAGGFANAAAVLIGAGDGTFLSPVTYTTGREPSILALADLNGDGQPDIITGDVADGTISVLLGNPDGTFQAREIFTGGSSGQLGVSDLNGDGRMDIVSADGGPSISLYMQK